MSQNRVAALTRSLTSVPSRRDVLRGLAAAGLGPGVPWFRQTAEARKKNKKKEKKPKSNAFGCLDVGQACRGKDATCCSGICQGKKPKKGKKDESKCVAHNAGICSADSDSCNSGVAVACNAGDPTCFCVLTTGNAGFCGQFTAGTDGHCRFCSKDTDCQAEFGAGAACVFLGRACTAICAATGGTACAPPCA